MKIGFFGNLIAALALLIAIPAIAQDELTEAEAREDLSHAYNMLEAEHVDLFARRSREDYDAHFETIYNGIDGPISRGDFALLLHGLLSFGEIGHAKTELGPQLLIMQAQQGRTIVPLSVTYRDGAMITDQWAMDGDFLPPGSHITHLGSLDMGEFEERASRIISADTPRLLRAQLEMGLPIYLGLIFGEVESLPVGFERPDGRREVIDVPAVIVSQMWEIQDARPVASPPLSSSNREYRDLGEGVFYLRPGPSSALPGEIAEGGDPYGIAGYASWVDEALVALRDSDADDLVIDLRLNPGGDTSFTDLLFSQLFDRPFRFASSYTVRAGANTKSIWADRERDAESISGQIAMGLSTTPTGETFAVEIPPVQPVGDQPFRGRVWALVDRHTYSNAAVAAAMLQDYGFATLMGVETADLATTFGAVESFTLPNSGAQVIYPKAYMVRPSGDESVRGVMPDVLLTENPVGSASDAMLEGALAEILRRR